MLVNCCNYLMALFALIVPQKSTFELRSMQHMSRYQLEIFQRLFSWRFTKLSRYKTFYKLLLLLIFFFWLSTIHEYLLLESDICEVTENAEFDCTTHAKIFPRYFSHIIVYHTWSTQLIDFSTARRWTAWTLRASSSLIWCQVSSHNLFSSLSGVKFHFYGLSYKCVKPNSFPLVCQSRSDLWSKSWFLSVFIACVRSLTWQAPALDARWCSLTKYFARLPSSIRRIPCVCTFSYD
jgi:hypothetical protein